MTTRRPGSCSSLPSLPPVRQIWLSVALCPEGIIRLKATHTNRQPPSNRRELFGQVAVENTQHWKQWPSQRSVDRTSEQGFIVCLPPLLRRWVNATPPAANHRHFLELLWPSSEKYAGFCCSFSQSMIFAYNNLPFLFTTRRNSKRFMRLFV